MLFSRHFEKQKLKFEQKSENFKIQDLRQLVTSFDYRCNGNQLDTTWFRLIESTNEACYMYQISCQSDELRRK